MIKQPDIQLVPSSIPKVHPMKKDETNTVSNQVIRKAKKGDEGAISSLYKTYVDCIFNYVAYRLSGDTKTAEDITSEVMIRMVRELPKYRITRAPFEAWLYRIASNQIVDYYRQHNRVIESNLSDSLASDAPDPERHLMESQRLHRLRTSMTKLKSEEQILLSLRFFERKSHEETAQMLGRSVSSIRTMQHRALKRLADLMQFDNEGE